MVNVTLQMLFPRERPGTHCIGVGGGAPSGLVWTGAQNLAPHQDSIPIPSSPKRVAILTTLTRMEHGYTKDVY